MNGSLSLSEPLTVVELKSNLAGWIGDLTMDAREWDRIADLLMQIRQKYAKQETTDTNSSNTLTHMVFTIDHLLAMNDKLANWTVRGGSDGM